MLNSTLLPLLVSGSIYALEPKSVPCSSEISMQAGYTSCTLIEDIFGCIWVCDGVWILSECDRPPNA